MGARPSRAHLHHRRVERANMTALTIIGCGSAKRPTLSTSRRTYGDPLLIQGSAGGQECRDANSVRSRARSSEAVPTQLIWNRCRRRDRRL